MLCSENEAEESSSHQQSYAGHFPTSISFTLFEERMRSRRQVPRSYRKYKTHHAPDYSNLKRHELNLVQSFEAQRSLFFVEQFYNHQRYWKLFAVNDAVLGQKKGLTRLNAIQDESEAKRVSSPYNSNHTNRSKSSSFAATGSKIYNSFGATNNSEVAEKNTDLLDDLCALDCATARSIEDLCDYMETDAIMRIKSLASQISEVVDAIVKEGDKAMTTLQNVNLYAAKAFEHCQRTAARILVAPGEGTTKSTSKASSYNTPVKRSSEVYDMWLADMQYRVAVFQQQEAWLNLTAVIKKLIDRLRTVEMERKSLTRDILLDTLERTNSLWNGLPSLSSQIVSFLEENVVTSEGLERDIYERIIKHQKLPSGSLRSILNMDFMPSPTEFNFSETIGMPLPSPLVLHAAVLERKEDFVVRTIKQSWTPCVVILTADKFLHIFDCKSNDESVVPTPEEAFTDLLPHIDPSASFSLKKDEKEVILQSTLSLDIQHHAVTIRERCTKPSHHCQFWVSEVVQNAGIKGFFKGESSKRVLLQARSRADRDEWLEKLKMNSVTSSPEYSSLGHVTPEKSSTHQTACHALQLDQEINQDMD